MLSTLTTATTSIGGVELVDQIPPLSPKIEILKLIIQLAIGIVGMFKILKSKKDVTK